jgi:hypothetical protein
VMKRSRTSAPGSSTGRRAARRRAARSGRSSATRGSACTPPS